MSLVLPVHTDVSVLQDLLLLLYQYSSNNKICCFMSSELSDPFWCFMTIYLGNIDLNNNFVHWLPYGHVLWSYLL